MEDIGNLDKIRSNEGTSEGEEVNFRGRGSKDRKLKCGQFFEKLSCKEEI